MIDPVSLTVAVGAIVVSVFVYWETRNLRKLTQVMVESLAFIAKSRRSSRTPGRARKLPPSTSPQLSTATLAVPTSSPLTIPAQPRASTAAGLSRIAIAQQREERKRLELQLRQQREQWKRQKDVAKAIGWVLDRMGSDELEEYNE